MRLVPVVLTMGLLGCTSAPPGEVADPYEPMNRQVHAFNKSVDANFVRPLTQAVKGDPVPHLVEEPQSPSLLEMVGNFGSNLALPGKMLNSLMQGRPEPIVRNGFRFVINTTVGLGGLLDPATADFGLPEIDTDFGETLHVWGVPAGAYLELPLVGPSNQRDATGRVVDFFMINPLDGLVSSEIKWVGTGARIVSKAGERARFGSTVDSVLHDSADSYAQTRLLYTQHRRFELKQEEDAIDPYAE